MLDRYLHIEELAIVFIGDFNPSIFQPYWFAKQGLIREQEANDADVEIVHKELVQFSLDWCKIEINQSKAIFYTEQKPYFEPLRDLVVESLKILKETPIRILGINYDYTLSLGDSKRYFQFGDVLSPVKEWTNYRNPRLQQLELVELKEPSGLGRKTIRITPGDKRIPFSVKVAHNDHFNHFSQGDFDQSDLVETLLENFDNVQKETLETTEQLIKTALNVGE